MSDVTRIDQSVRRAEGGAAMMAEACGKPTGRPGIRMMTRGPGATNACHGVHIATQDLAACAVAFVGHGERLEATEKFAPAFERARASAKPAILHCRLDPRALSVGRDHVPAGSPS